MIKENVGSLWKISEYYTTEASVLCIEAVSYFHLYGYRYHHNHIDVVPLAAGTPEMDDDPVALYLGYYN
jgi:hypothetical protein